MEARRLGVLAAIGREAHLEQDEKVLVAEAVDRLRAVFPGDSLAIRLGDAPVEADGSSPAMQGPTSRHRLTIPLRSDARTLGLLVAERSQGPFNERAEDVLESAANQLAVMIENGRLYRQVERLFRAYLSPDVVRTLLADPTQAGLGGAATEATVLFADLRGYTEYSVGQDPAAIVGLLNRYFGVVVPAVLAEGGTVTSFVGDAIMAIFNAPVAQPDHPLRAARAALAMQVAIERLVADDPRFPRFRVGIETGPVVVGNIGAPEVRAFTAIGQTTNLAARLQAYAPAGGIVVGPVAAAQLAGLVRLRPLGAIEFKGFPEPIEACELEGLRAD
jgi:class 3 adenylate cyclase